MENESKFAPVVLFVYSRLWHTRETVESLLLNKISESTELIIYSDGSRDSRDSTGVNDVREYIKTIKGFKSMKIIYRDTNLGLARNIVLGLSEVFNIHEMAIVVEDDLKVNNNFLNYMNFCLNKYVDSSNIWHVSGWSDTASIPFLDGTYYLSPVMYCWGWGTWSAKWKRLINSCDFFIDEFGWVDKIKFTRLGTRDFYEQILSNKYKKIHTWAVFWAATIYFYNGLCVTPIRSRVYNIGLDGSGENCKQIDNMGYNKKTFFNGEIVEGQTSHILSKYYTLVSDLIALYRRIIKKYVRLES